MSGVGRVQIEIDYETIGIVCVKYEAWSRVIPVKVERRQVVRIVYRVVGVGEPCETVE